MFVLGLGVNNLVISSINKVLTSLSMGTPSLPYNLRGYYTYVCIILKLYIYNIN